MNRLAFALLLPALAIPAAAQKKPPTPTVNPEIAYVDSRVKFPELKLADENLTGSFLVFRSQRQGFMPRYDLSPRGQNQVAVTSAGLAYLVSWNSNGSTVSLTTLPLTAPSGEASNVSFSPDGSRIAVSYFGDEVIRIFDTATRAMVAEWPVADVYWMTYFGTGSKIAFIRYGAPKIFELDPATGTISSSDFLHGDLQFLGGGHGSNALLITYRTPGGRPEDLYFGRWENGAMTTVRIGQGWDAQYNCSETRVVFKATGSHATTRVYNVTTNTTGQLTNNVDLRRFDYVPTCAQ